MDFRIIGLNCGGFIPQALIGNRWYGIGKERTINRLFGDNKYITYYGIEQSIKRCKVSTEEKSEKIIDDYYDWLCFKAKTESFEVVKLITKE